MITDERQITIVLMRVLSFHSKFIARVSSRLKIVLRAGTDRYLSLLLDTQPQRCNNNAHFSTKRDRPDERPRE